MHPLKTNMRLSTAAAAQARGGILSQEEEEQLPYADMLIDVSNNRNSPWCQVIEQEDENVSKLSTAAEIRLARSMDLIIAFHHCEC